MAQRSNRERLTTLEEQLARLEEGRRVPPPVPDRPSGDYRVPLLATEFDMETAVFPPAVFAWRDPTQTTTSGVLTPIALTSELYDTDAMHDTSTNNTRITINTPGVYLLDGHSSWAADPVDGSITFYFNGTANIQISNVVGDYRSMNLTEVRNFVVGDYIELAVLQISGGDLATVSASGKYSTFSATWLGPD